MIKKQDKFVRYMISQYNVLKLQHNVFQEEIGNLSILVKIYVNQLEQTSTGILYLWHVKLAQIVTVQVHTHIILITDIVYWIAHKYYLLFLIHNSDIAPNVLVSIHLCGIPNYKYVESIARISFIRTRRSIWVRCRLMSVLVRNNIHL
jgi:hypothetical protein